MLWGCVLTIVLHCVFGQSYNSQAPRPVIGILTQEAGDPAVNLTSFISASYVKQVESTGALVVPILIGQNEHYYRNLMEKLNGIVLPGGNVNFSSPNGYASSSKFIFDIALQMNNEGDYFPILGVCQGLEVLAYVSNNNVNPLSKCACNNVNYPLNFLPGSEQSTLYSWMTAEELMILRDYPVTSNHHYFCLTESDLEKHGLNTKWRVLTTNQDMNGIQFISSMEWVNGLPFVGVQFHPEKAAYEWRPDQNNPHQFNAVKINRVFYDWVSMSSRRNSHSYPNSSELFKDLILNYCPVYTGKFNGYNEQVFYFQKNAKPLYNHERTVKLI